eukprot:scaffold620_cov103-Cylindrotheca_fusiformis.AAC.6
MTADRDEEANAEEALLDKNEKQAVDWSRPATRNPSSQRQTQTHFQLILKDYTAPWPCTDRLWFIRMKHMLWTASAWGSTVVIVLGMHRGFLHGSWLGTAVFTVPREYIKRTRARESGSLIAKKDDRIFSSHHGGR